MKQPTRRSCPRRASQFAAQPNLATPIAEWQPMAELDRQSEPDSRRPACEPRVRYEDGCHRYRRVGCSRGSSLWNGRDRLPSSSGIREMRLHLTRNQWATAPVAPTDKHWAIHRWRSESRPARKQGRRESWQVRPASHAAMLPATPSTADGRPWSLDRPTFTRNPNRRWIGREIASRLLPRDPGLTKPAATHESDVGHVQK